MDAERRGLHLPLARNNRVEVISGPDGPRASAMGHDFHFDRPQTILTIEWDFADVDYDFCSGHGALEHPVLVEFYLNIDPADWGTTVEEMKKFGCTERFVAAFVAAKDLGAEWICYSDEH